MKKYKLIIEFAQEGDIPPETIIDMDFKAPNIEEAERFGKHISDQTEGFNVVPMKANGISKIYYHRVFEV